MISLFSFLTIQRSCEKSVPSQHPFIRPRLGELKALHVHKTTWERPQSDGQLSYNDRVWEDPVCHC